METTPNLLPIVSTDGRRNAYYHACRLTEQQRPYAACLKIVQDMKDNNASDLYSDCNAHIKACICPAMGMRDREMLEGRAIYFIERQSVQVEGTGAAQKMREFFESMKKAAKGTIGRMTAPAVKAPKKVRDEDLLDAVSTPSYADVINAALAKKAGGTPVGELTVFAAAPAAPKSRLNILPGETPAQAARRQRLSTITT